MSLICLAEGGNPMCAAHYHFSAVAVQEVLCIQQLNTVPRGAKILTWLSLDINFLFSRLFYKIKYNICKVLVLGKTAPLLV